MKRVCLLLVVVFLATLCAQSFALTVDEIIEKNIKARGGIEKLKAIKSLRLTGKMTMQGMEIPFTILQKRPSNMRFESSFQGMTMVQAFDGETAWGIMPFTGSSKAQKLPEAAAKDLKNEANIDGFLVDYKDKGHTIELVGKEDLEGTEVYHLKVTTEEKDVWQIYLDTEHFLELRMTGKAAPQGAEILVDTQFSDYKEVAGVIMAHSIVIMAAGQIMNNLVFTKIEANVEIDDAVFKMPVEKEKEEVPAKEKTPEKEEDPDKG